MTALLIIIAIAAGLIAAGARVWVMSRDMDEHNGR
jgi:hypothetical protein